MNVVVSGTVGYSLTVGAKTNVDLLLTLEDESRF